MLPNFKRPEADASKPGAAPPPATPALGAMTASRPSAPPLRAGGDRNAPSVIGPDLVITGNLVSKGEMQVDGEVQGDIRATNLIVGERARITGTVVAEEAVIRGQVMGSIRSRRVMLQSTSRVEGDIYHQSLAIEQGAYFEGKSRRSDDPMAGIGAPAAGRAAASASAAPSSESIPAEGSPPPLLTPVSS